MAVVFSFVFVVLFCGVACSLTILVRIYLRFDGHPFRRRAQGRPNAEDQEGQPQEELIERGNCS